MSNLIEGEIASLVEKKKESLQHTNKSAYIKEKVFEYKQKWWEALDKMFKSEEKDERRTAIVEYNKLQCRILPTEITGPDGDQVVLNVVNYGLNNGLLKKEEESDDNK